MIRPWLRPNTFKHDPTRAPPEHFKAKFSYGYENLEAKKCAQRRKHLSKKQRDATGTEPKARRGGSHRRDPTGHNRCGVESEAAGKQQSGTKGNTTAVEPKARQQVINKA